MMMNNKLHVDVYFPACDNKCELKYLAKCHQHSICNLLQGNEEDKKISIKLELQGAIWALNSRSCRF